MMVSDVPQIIESCGFCRAEKVKSLRAMKSGMTNRSYSFCMDDKRYIIRIPGEGTDRLINRKQEHAVYNAISSLGISEDVYYFDPKTGIKIAAYLTDAHVCDSSNWEEVERCLSALKRFHAQKLHVSHSFDLWERLAFYESLWNGAPSVYADYDKTKQTVLSLKGYIDAQPKSIQLCHIDAVPDNFLFVTGKDGSEEIKLTDWEYAGMQDPHLDVAMFIIYAMYDRDSAEKLIDLYFSDGCDKATRLKIYCYIAILLSVALCGATGASSSVIAVWSSALMHSDSMITRESIPKSFSRNTGRHLAEIMSEHIVERAIIMAAGIGQRLRPVTLTTPKPLVTVNGVCMIDTIIAALHENEIHEIYVVVGYLKEQFYEWAKKYNGITLIENPWYAECNNIASLYVAREYLNNAIVLDGDQIIRNPAILHREFTRSGYSCAWTDRATNEWLLTVKNGIVTKCSHTGGDHGWQLFSVSRWTAEDGQRLRKHLELEFVQNENRSIYWDDVAMFCHPDEYQFGVYPISAEDLREIDSFTELCEADSSYRGRVN
jgi:CTP:phosphocholine cytidylyltransferase-like protein/thiamine kinase-like enzyme